MTGTGVGQPTPTAIYRFTNLGKDRITAMLAPRIAATTPPQLTREAMRVGSRLIAQLTRESTKAMRRLVVTKYSAANKNHRYSCVTTPRWYT